MKSIESGGGDKHKQHMLGAAKNANLLWRVLLNMVHGLLVQETIKDLILGDSLEIYKHQQKPIDEKSAMF